MNLNLWNQLTLDEKHALELRKDFGITDQDIKDVIRFRGRAESTPTLEDLQTRVRWAENHVRFYASREGEFARGQEQMYRRVAADYARDVAYREAELTAPVLSVAAE